MWAKEPIREIDVSADQLQEQVPGNAKVVVAD